MPPASSPNPTPSPKPNVKRGPGSFFTGATYPLRALRLFLQTPKLRGFVLFPILVNLIVGGTLYAALLFAGLRAIDTFIADAPTWANHVAHLPPPNLPDFPAPHWTLKIPHWHLDLPNWLPALPHWHISLPNINFPSINLPDINLPSWSVPSWNVPSWAIAIANVLGESFLWILRLILVLLLLLVTGFIFLQFGVLLGAPWYGKLSEELELLKLGKLPPMESNLGSTLRDVGRAILYELKKIVLLIFIGLPLLLFNIVPGFGTAIASIGYITLTATIVCLDFFDSPLERRRLRFRQKLGVVGKSLPASAGFGLVCFALVSVPLINLLAIPICVAGGTLFFCDRVHPWLDP